MANDPAMFNLIYEREDKDLYPTPAWVTEAVIPFLMLHILKANPVWEPACGKGHMADVLHNHFDTVLATDIVDYGYQQQAFKHDFLNDTPPASLNIDAVITNPPYGIDAENFIRTALDYTKQRRGLVAMLLRNEYDSSKSRVDLFNKPPFARKVVLTSRPRWIEGSTGAPRHNYAWFIWDWEHRDRAELSYHVKVK